MAIKNIIEKIKDGVMDFIKEIEIENKGLDNYPGMGVGLTNPIVDIPPTTLYEYLTFTFYENDVVQAVGKGIPATIVVDRDCIIDRIYTHLETAPGAGKTLTVDVNWNGSTIFTTQANRPSITGTNVTGQGIPNQVVLSKDDKLTMDIDVSDGNADKLSVYVRCHKRI